jgi:hypothetical protein
LVEAEKACEAEEVDLELRLEEVRGKKQQTRQQALEFLAQAMEDHDEMRHVLRMGPARRWNR